MRTSPIVICFNGEEKLIHSSTVKDLFNELKLTGRKVAIELNKTIVPRAQFAQTELSSGDRVEVVQFVGGG